MPTLEELVHEYVDGDHFCRCDDELRIFEGLPLAQAISLAALSGFDGKRHSHQRRLMASTLREARARLLDALPRIQPVASFGELYQVVTAVFAPIWGAGSLYTYDVARRVGTALSIEPDMVYLHAGTREGAKHLGVHGDQAPISAFPKALHRLTPGQAEDFLCIFKGRLAQAALVQNS